MVTLRASVTPSGCSGRPAEAVLALPACRGARKACIACPATAPPDASPTSRRPWPFTPWEDLRTLAKRGYEGAVTTDHDQQAQAIASSSPIAFSKSDRVNSCCGVRRDGVTSRD
jgi:hypothetical protein